MRTKPDQEQAQPKEPVALRRSDAPHCPVRSCSAVGVPLLDKFGGVLTGTYLLDRAPAIKPVVTSLMIGVPQAAVLQEYLDFTHLFAAAPTDYLTPHESWVLLRHQGRITHAKRVLWTMFNERRRRTDDSAYRSTTGSAFMAPGHVIRVDEAVPIRRAFRWLDARHGGGLTAGSILDQKGGEPFRWQMAMVVPTTDKRRIARSPFTVIRTSDLQVPTMSSIGERQLSNAVAREGVAVCQHLESLRLPDGLARPDIIIPETRSIVEYDGSYWHHGAKNQERDIKKSRKFLDDGWQVIRVREPGLEPLALKSRGFRQLSMNLNETGDAIAARVLAALR
jgi:G:T-mismatch repair DNA endonuclease (very short patch repair protein)